MLNKIFSLIFLLTFTFSIFSQTASDNEVLRKEMFSTYGFCKGQALTLQNISIKFPELRGQVLKAESTFNTTFGKSCEHLENLFSDEIKKALNDKLQQIANFDSLTLENANKFIVTVQNRSEGDINSPWKETLLSFNPDFNKNPEWEFSRGFTKKYATKDHPKAKGLNLEISIPISWKAREGNRPNIVQFFKEKNGYGEVALVFQVRAFIPPKGIKVTQKDLDELFSERGLKYFLDENSTLIESKPIVLEGQKGGMLVYDTLGERLDVKLKLRTLSYVTIYKNRLIMIQFAVGNTENKFNEVTKEFEKNKPLFKLIANSLVILDKYK